MSNVVLDIKSQNSRLQEEVHSVDLTYKDEK